MLMSQLNDFHDTIDVARNQSDDDDDVAISGDIDGFESVSETGDNEDMSKGVDQHPIVPVDLGDSDPSLWTPCPANYPFELGDRLFIVKTDKRSRVTFSQYVGKRSTLLAGLWLNSYVGHTFFKLIFLYN